MDININMCTTLRIENNVKVDDLNVICDFFENYQLGKVKCISHCDTDNSAMLELEYWYDNNLAKNTYERMCIYGETKIVYNDPEYFTIKFLNLKTEENYNNPSNSVIIQNNDYRNLDNNETADYREDYIERENNIDNNSNFSSENSINILELYGIIEKMQETILNNAQLINCLQKRLTKISRKTNILYKNRPNMKRSNIWKNRLRNR